MSDKQDKEVLLSGRVFAVFTVSSLAVVMSAVAFWFADWQYSLPTVRPAGLVQPSLLETIHVPLPKQTSSDQRPVLLHFFNPGCPCSRFNLDHVRALHAKYKQQVRFVAVLVGEDPESEAQFSRLGLNVDSVTDRSGALATAAGVYSTPQAVLLDTKSRLRYRGNYNTSRYCTSRETEFARLAIDALIANQPIPEFPRPSSIAFGCPFQRRIPGSGRLS